MASRAKPVEMKWPVWILLAVMVSPALLLTYNAVNEALLNRHYIALGKATSCIERPNWESMQRCNATMEGEACLHETQTALMDWYGPIDYACAKSEPGRMFRFQVRPQEVEYAEAG